jgi:RNA polymerase sigma-70 factor (ECF subfamily)
MGMTAEPDNGTTPLGDDAAVVAALRAGDGATFAALVDRYHAPLLRFAGQYVRGREVAEDVVQATWLGLLESLDRFEGRASLKTWIFRIALNIARTRGRKEARSIPFSAFAPVDDDDPAVAPERFQGANGWFPGHWATKPAAWAGSPEERALSSETRQRVRAAIDDLPPAQREIIVLRDVEGLTADEACNLLGISSTNQRVLLHRARSKVRAALEPYLAGA